MKRGQSALEYLVTYGWAILAIVIVAAVLWYFGIFNPSRWVPSQECTGFASFTCIGYNSSSTAISVALGNNMGRTLNISNATCSPTSLGANVKTTCSISGTFTSGDRVSIQIDYTDVMSGLSHSDYGFVKVA